MGRPRRLTIHQLLDAALELGLDDLSMARLADRLGVGIATLYRQVGSRDELLRLAAARQAVHHSFPVDRGQHWSAFVNEYARALFDLLTGESQLIARYIDGGLGPEVEIDSVELFLNALVTRGFAPEEAMRLFRSTGQIVMGTAVAWAHSRAMQGAGTSHASAARLALAHRDEDELPLLRSCMKDYCDEARRCDWEETLTHLLRGVAARRGETLPEGTQAT